MEDQGTNAQGTNAPWSKADFTSKIHINSTFIIEDFFEEKSYNPY